VACTLRAFPATRLSPFEGTLAGSRTASPRPLALLPLPLAPHPPGGGGAGIAPLSAGSRWTPRCLAHRVACLHAPGHLCPEESGGRGHLALFPLRSPLLSSDPICRSRHHRGPRSPPPPEGSPLTLTRRPPLAARPTRGSRAREPLASRGPRSTPSRGTAPAAAPWLHRGGVRAGARLAWPIRPPLLVCRARQVHRGAAGFKALLHRRVRSAPALFPALKHPLLPWASGSPPRSSFGRSPHLPWLRGATAPSTEVSGPVWVIRGIPPAVGLVAGEPAPGPRRSLSGLGVAGSCRSPPEMARSPRSRRPSWGS